MSVKKTCSIYPGATIAGAVLLMLAVPARADAAVSDRTITTPRHAFTVDDVGLPAQLEIRAFTNDIPLAFRAEKKWSEALLKMVSRGPQLASPMRIEATVDKAVVPAKADAPAVLNETDKGVEATATWQAGSLKGRLSLLYANDGSMTGQLTYEAKGIDLERLDLVMELNGAVDTALAGNPAEALAGNQPLPPQFGTLDPAFGVVWSDGSTPAGDGGGQNGQIGHFFLGNGDRGFTWLAHGAAGFSIGGKEPSVTVERKRDGPVIWKIAIVNQAPRGGEQTAGFTLLVHPSRLPAADRRTRQWQPWTEKAATPALDAASRGSLAGDNVLVRAEAASVCEAVAARAILEGAVGGDALTAAATIADRFPLALFRYLTAPHTALAVQLRSNGAALGTPGGSPAVDNMILGRALLHDIGVEIAGLASRANAADVVNALEEFGYFKDDGQTEFLPYWRAEDFGIGLVRYGELFEAEVKAGFAATTENPAGRVRVSVFMRPATGPKGEPSRKALMVIVNESEEPVREFLYIENPAYVFADYNKITSANILAQHDYSHIPADGDWRRSASVETQPLLDQSQIKVTVRLKTQKDKSVRAAAVIGSLEDVVSKGYVQTTKMGPAFAMYGPIHIPARGMRLLMGSGAPSAGIMGSVWKVTKDGTRAPVASAPVYVFGGGGIPVVEKMELSKARPIAAVRTADDGTFRVPLGGGDSVTVVAEVDGKLYPDRQILTRTKEGVSAVWPATSLELSINRGGGKVDHYYWAESVIEALEGNSMPKIADGPARPEPERPWTAPLTGMEFVWIPAGEFDMGSPASEAGRSDNETLHHVKITKGFWMGKYEVTQGQWMRVTGGNPSQFKYAGDTAPVENVSWQDCQRFVIALNALSKGAGVRYRLPTEAEWEYACRAGTATALYNGGLTIKGTLNGPELDEIAWYGGNSGVKGGWGFDTRKWRDRQFDSALSGTHPVGQKKPNAWGLHDMLGNVSEWVADQYTNDLGTAAVTDPFISPFEGNAGVDALFSTVGVRLGAVVALRGGSWYRIPSGCRAAYRQADLAPHGEFAPPTDSFDVGLRLVCELETVEQAANP
ncbi:MAG: formylglycine-generating enzyme family protein [Lentisphaerae bacterium]|nr:formylglycine-generating enzyme family protein [Lentisphaerota bacterium]